MFSPSLAVSRSRLSHPHPQLWGGASVPRRSVAVHREATCAEQGGCTSSGARRVVTFDRQSQSPNPIPQDNGRMRQVREMSKQECITRHKVRLAVEFDEGGAHAARR